ncbi:ARID DNA-binding domain-containing protein, partial [Tanacetum coccineum]
FHPPISNDQVSNVKSVTSKSKRSEKPASKKDPSTPCKRSYDPDLFFKVNGKLYQRLGKIGSGGSSEVHKVISHDCTIYALKKIKLKGRDYATAYGFCQEIEYLNKLMGKDHIIQLIDYEEFGTIGEILGLSKENGEDIKKYYIKYLDVFTSYYKTARVPQQEYKAILKKSTRKVEEDKDRDCLMSHQWDFGETCAPTANIAVQKEKEKLEHFGVKLEDTEDGEDNQPQPISSHYTRNQNLQGKIIGPSTSRKLDIGDSGSNTSDDFTIIT